MEGKEREKLLSRKGCITCGQEFDHSQSVCPDDGTILTPLNDDKLVGTVLADRYEVLEVIGGGGMGLVYKARHRLMNRVVAIKTLHRHLISSAETLKRFQLEAQAASCLSLPNILTIYDFGLTEEGQPYMVMDYLEGIGLSDILDKEGRLNVERFLGIFSQACAGLAHAHQKGVLHRDIKPSNIMLVNYGDQSDFVKIVDFGIAKLLNQTDAGSKNLTKTGEVYGSPSFMSPEQCRGKELDARSDIYAMGCVMYRAITGQNPHQGTDIIELLFKQVSETPPTFDQVCPELSLPDELQRIIFKAIAKDPNKRYQTMNELKDALDQMKDKLAGKTQDGTKQSDAVKPLWKRPGGSIGEKLEGNLDIASSAKLDAAALPAVPYLSAPADDADTSVAGATSVPAQENLDKTQVRSSGGSVPPSLSTAVQSSSGGAPVASHAQPQAAGSKVSEPIRLSDSRHAENRSGEFRHAEHKAPPEGSNAAVRRSLSRAVNQQQRLMIAGIAVAVIGIFAVVWILARNTMNSSSESSGDNPSGNKAAQSASANPDNFGAGTDTAGATTESLQNGRAALTSEQGKDQTIDGHLKSAQEALDAGDGDKAQVEANAAVALATKAGQEPKSMSACLTMLGRAYLSQSKYEEAKAALTKALYLRDNKFGRDSKPSAETLGYLGRALTGAQAYREAEKMLKSDLQVTEKLYGATKRETAVAQIALGDLYDKENNTREARKYYSDALKILNQVSGKFDPVVASADVALAQILAGEKKYSDASQLCKHALAIRQELYGAESGEVKEVKSLQSELDSQSAGAEETAVETSSESPKLVVKHSHHHHYAHSRSDGAAPAVRRRHAYSSYGL